MDYKVIVGLALGLVLGVVLGALANWGAQQQQAAPPTCPTSVDVIKKRGKLILGTSADWPPYEYVEGGQVVGIDVEIAKRIANALGVQLEIRDMKFSGLIEAVKRGEVDLVLADMAITPEREAQVLFSIPYQVDGSVVITLGSGKIASVDDLRGKAIGVQIGTVQEDWAVKTLGNSSKIVRYDKVYPYMVEALKKGDLDAIVVGGVVGRALVTKFPELRQAFSVGVRYSAAAMPLCAHDLKLAVDKVIYNMLQSGEMERLINSWVEKWLYG